jgi:isopenicillin-N epimerase
VDTARPSRRRFLKAFGYAGAMSTAWAAPSQDAQAVRRPDRDEPVTANTSWADFRHLFELRPDRIHMSGMVIASHPVPVSRVIDLHRAELQKDPVRYIDENRWRLEGETLRAASHYSTRRQWT